MLVGQDFARETLRLDQRVEFRKTKVYYMEGLNSSLCPKVDDEMLVCLKNVSGFFSKNTWILQRNIRTHSFDYFWMHFEIWSLKCSGVYSARCLKYDRAVVGWDWVPGTLLCFWTDDPIHPLKIQCIIDTRESIWYINTCPSTYFITWFWCFTSWTTYKKFDREWC